MRIKKLNSMAKMPLRAINTDAGIDLYATSISIEGDIVTYGVGLAFEIPENHFGLLTNRSSVYKKDLQINTGIIDSGYRGEVKVKFRKFGNNIYDLGERVAQLVVIPYTKVDLEFSDNLSNTERDNKGFGHSGNK